jgi:hypothetical protein
MDELEALQAIAPLHLFPDDIDDRRDKAALACPEPNPPVVARTRVTEQEVVRPEQLAERTTPDRIQRVRLQIYQDGPRNVPAPGSFIIVHINPIKLHTRVTIEVTRRYDPVLARDDFPEPRSDVIATLTDLDDDDFPDHPPAPGDLRVEANPIGGLQKDPVLIGEMFSIVYVPDLLFCEDLHLESLNFRQNFIR